MRSAVQCGDVHGGGVVVPRHGERKRAGRTEHTSAQINDHTHIHPPYTHGEHHTQADAALHLGCERDDRSGEWEKGAGASSAQHSSEKRDT